MAKGYSKKKKKETKGKTGSGRPAILDIVDAAWGTETSSIEGDAQYGAGALSTALSTTGISPRRGKKPSAPSRPRRP